MSRLENNVAIVTGAARGSGRAIATRFVTEGAEVILADVLDDRGQATAAEIGQHAVYRHCDVSDEANWADLIAYTVGRFGSLNVLVNNAAVLHIGEIRETSVDAYMRVARVNELGTFLGIRAAIDPLIAAGGGSVINISSIDGHYAAARTSAYSASKFAVRGLTKVAALELGRFGIRVNCICPAVGNPEMVTEALSTEEKDALGLRDGTTMRDRFRPPPVGRFGELDDVASTAVFLASDESAFYTGADFMLDGGSTAGMHPLDVPQRS
jgi:3alpha(or 20beta)-hydroxysteroid dehydrogenase